MNDFPNIKSKLVGSVFHSSTIEYLKFVSLKFHQSHKVLIDNYLYLKSKIEEFESRMEENLQYKLSVFNSKSSGKVINARVKLPFAPMNDKKSKYPYFNIHVGKLSNYKLGLDDPRAKSDAEKKIKKFINEKFPFTIKTIDNQVITLLYPDE